MKIACLGWGSLVWDPGALHIASEWFADGPALPIEFARESRGRRLTLVITPGSPLVRSLWALSSFDSVETSVADLASRERIKPDKVLHGIGVWGPGTLDLRGAELEIAQWAARLNLDAVVWTNLKPRFADQQRTPDVEEVVTYIRGLSPEHRASAEQYVRFTPRQIDTPYRRRIQQEFGWTPQGRL